MDVEQERDPRADDQALEEIRRLFARYRRIARHGAVMERDDDEAEDAAPLAASAGPSWQPARPRDR